MDRSGVRYSCLVATCLLIVVLVCVKLFSTQIVDALLKSPELALNRISNDYVASNRTCSHETLRRYYAKYHHFPSNGSWRSAKQREYFEPSFCRLNKVVVDSDFVKQCLRRRNVNYLVTLGNSNGAYAFDAILKMVGSATGSECVLQRNESHRNKMRPDVDYFSKGNSTWAPYLLTHYRLCGTCGGRMYTCHLHGNTSLTLEHLPMTHLMDTSVQVLTPEQIRRKSRDFDVWATSTQEFYFRYYLRDPPPDVLIIFLPFNHIKLTHSVDRAGADMEYFRRLTKLYIQNTTRVYYIPQFAENDDQLVGLWKGLTYEGMLPTEVTHKLNTLFYQTFETDLLNKTSNVFGFMDSIPMSLQKSAWFRDGLHMKDVWYDVFMTLFFQFFCED